MKSVTKSALKAKMLQYFREVQKTGEPLVVTDNGVPVLKVIPIKSGQNVDEVFEKFRKKVGKTQDVLAPTTNEWEET